MHPFLQGLIALLNLGAIGSVPAQSATPPIHAYEESFRTSMTIASAASAGDWQETKLQSGAGTSRLARSEDYSVPVTEDEVVQSPIISSLSEADPTTEVVWDPESGTDFVDSYSQPLAVWAETKLFPPPPPPAPAPARAPSARPSTPARTAAKPKTSSSRGVEPTNETPNASGGAIALTVPGGGAHRFPWGQCTYYVASRRKITFRGNANQWPKNARAAGYRTGQTPVVGAIAVTNEHRVYGHVGYVEKVNSDGSFTFSEMNYAGLGVVTRRTMKTSDRRFITFVY